MPRVVWWASYGARCRSESTHARCCVCRVKWWTTPLRGCSDGPPIGPRPVRASAAGSGQRPVLGSVVPPGAAGRLSVRQQSGPGAGEPGRRVRHWPGVGEFWPSSRSAAGPSRPKGPRAEARGAGAKRCLRHRAEKGQEGTSLRARGARRVAAGAATAGFPPGAESSPAPTKSPPNRASSQARTGSPHRRRWLARRVLVRWSGRGGGPSVAGRASTRAMRGEEQDRSLSGSRAADGLPGQCGRRCPATSPGPAVAPCPGRRRRC